MKKTIGYIDTSDKINHKQLKVNMIFNLLDRIEDKLGDMAHQIPEITEKLQKWQDKKVSDSFFYNYLTGYWDKINGQE